MPSATSSTCKPSRTAGRAARRLRAITDRPVCVGIGVSNAEQAVEITADADGVVIGSALVRRLLDGEGPDGAARFVGEVRAALDASARGPA